MNKELYELSYSLKKEMRQRVLSIVCMLVAVYIVINLILAFVIFPVRQVSVSMESDVGRNSCIMFSPLKKHFGRGAVVLVNPLDSEDVPFLKKAGSSFVSFVTAGQVSAGNMNNLVGKERQIRRVVGLPGDTIYMRDYVLYIKPRGEKYFLTEFELAEKSYNVNVSTNPAGWDNSIGVIGSFEEMTLGRNEYFVLGDSRISCIDSRLWGPLKKDDVCAGAVLQYFPFSRLSLF